MNFPGWDDIPEEACIRCALIEDKLADYHVKREWLLIELELTESILGALAASLAVHDGLNHEDVGDGAEDPEED